MSELNKNIKSKGEIGNYLTEIVKYYYKDEIGRSKIIWDISAIAYLLNNNWVSTNLMNSPILTEDITWSFDKNRHLILSAYYVNRDLIFKDFFKKMNMHNSNFK